MRRRVIRALPRVLLLVAEMAGIAWWVARNGPPPGGWASLLNDPFPYVFLGLLIGVWTMALENIIQIITGSTADQMAEQEARYRKESLAREEHDRAVLEALAGTLAAVQQDVEATTALLRAGLTRNEAFAELLQQVGAALAGIQVIAEQARAFMLRNDRGETTEGSDGGGPE